MRMQRIVIAAAAIALVPFAADAASITLTSISTLFSSPIGIDYHEPTNSVVISANYPTGNPHTLERINQNGSHTGFSALAGVEDEIKVATARSGNVGGFLAGELFTGNGVDGQIVRVSPDGGTVLNPWVSLPGDNNGLLRGSLYVDRTGEAGGDLIAVTTNGEIWRINSAGTPTKLNDANVHLEGLLVVPNNVARYGTIAGKIIAGAENEHRLYMIDPTTGDMSFITLTVAVEDIDMIDANSNFFGVNYGTGRLLGADAAQFVPFVGDILLTQEQPAAGHSGLSRLLWDGSSLVTEEFTIGAGSPVIGQWEHVTFAPAGIREIPTTVPEPSTLALLGAGLAGFGWLRRRRTP
jgi:hypothetical protein